MGHHRHIAVQLPNFVPAVRVVESSDLLLTVPKLFASDIISMHSNLAVYDLPFETKEFDYSMIWHERHEFDPGHQWLREIIQKAFI